MELKQLFDLFKVAYQKELDYYLELLILSKEQREVIKENKLDKLQELLKDKDEIIKKINQLEEKIKPYKEKIIEALSLKEEDWWLELKGSQIADNDLKMIIEKIIDLLNNLVRIDKENQRLMQDNKIKLIQEMNRVKTGSKVNKSYNNKPTRIHSTFIDNKR